MAEIPQLLRSSIDIGHRQIVHRMLTRGDARQDREIAHTRSLDLMRWFQAHPNSIRLMHQLFAYENPILKTKIGPLELDNPFILPAGFDKKAEVHQFLGKALGMGAVTVGTITKRAYEGNPRPRIFDLPNNNGLINRMGFPGDGIFEAQKKLLYDEPQNRSYRLIISIGASKPSFEKKMQVNDFIEAANTMSEFGEGIEGNVSSPNTGGVIELQQPEVFKDLAEGVKIVIDSNLSKKPIVIWKFSPDLDDESRIKNATIAKDNGAAAVNLGNITTDPEIKNFLAYDVYSAEKGGVSGEPLKERALEVSNKFYYDFGEEMPIIFNGGIANSQDLWRALTYGGATAIGAYTAFVRPNTSTPNFVYYLLRNLAKAMEKEDMKSMDDFKALRGKITPYPLARK